MHGKTHSQVTPEYRNWEVPKCILYNLTLNFNARNTKWLHSYRDFGTSYTHDVHILACTTKVSDDYRQKHGKVCGTGDSLEWLLLGVVALPPVADAWLNTQRKGIVRVIVLSPVPADQCLLSCVSESWTVSPLNGLHDHHAHCLGFTLNLREGGGFKWWVLGLSLVKAVLWEWV